MKASSVRVATFVNADIGDLMDDINKFLNGEPVTGPPAYAADFIKEKEFVGVQFQSDGTNYSAMLSYAE